MSDHGYIELPRNPVDFKIDPLSERALKMLVEWPYAEGRPAERFFGDTNHLAELIAARLVEPTGNEQGGGDGMILTFDGWNASERIRCGIYDEHKRLYQGRAKRDQDDEDLLARAIF